MILEPFAERESQACAGLTHLLEADVVADGLDGFHVDQEQVGLETDDLSIHFDSDNCSFDAGAAAAAAELNTRDNLCRAYTNRIVLLLHRNRTTLTMLKMAAD